MDMNTVIRDFNFLYHANDNQTWRNTKWLGIHALKNPLDLWIYQEIIYELRPDIIIETGTANGGSALYLASIYDLVNGKDGIGEVISVDIENIARPQHKRIRYLLGSSISQGIIDTIRNIIDKEIKEKNKELKIMVVLDSDHTKNHVLNELRLYSKFVTKGQYLIVEDTNIGHPASPWFGPGPMEAVMEFFKEPGVNNEFFIDKSKEKFYLTFNPNGYLRRL